MYSIGQYGGMIKDAIRMTAYEEAIRRAVKPSSVVLDIGTGTGIHAFMAAREGARHVYAIEPADAIHIARDLARANGLADRITFIQDMSTRISLPEKADVLVSDLHGTLPWFGSHIPTIVDARERLLREDAVLVPEGDTVYIGAVEAPDLYSAFVEPWRSRPFGFEMGEVANRLTNSFSRGRVGRDAFLAPFTTIASLDYGTVRDPNVDVAISLAAERPGTCHGLILWFDTRVSGDLTLTSAPFEPEISYGSAFFPLTDAVEVEPGDAIAVRFRGVLQGGEYVWVWETRITREDGTTRAGYQQNSLAAQLPSLDRLRKQAPLHRPKLDPRGEIDREILLLMNGERHLDEITERITASWSGRLPIGFDVFDRVRELSAKYG